jgi:hypothetical protein
MQLNKALTPETVVLAWDNVREAHKTLGKLQALTWAKGDEAGEKGADEKRLELKRLRLEAQREAKAMIEPIDERIKVAQEEKGRVKTELESLVKPIKQVEDDLDARIKESRHYREELQRKLLRELADNRRTALEQLGARQVGPLLIKGTMEEHVHQEINNLVALTDEEFEAVLMSFKNFIVPEPVKEPETAPRPAQPVEPAPPIITPEKEPERTPEPGAPPAPPPPPTAPPVGTAPKVEAVAAKLYEQFCASMDRAAKPWEDIDESLRLSWGELVLLAARELKSPYYDTYKNPR